jgi:hypothetical protein
MICSAKVKDVETESLSISAFTSIRLRSCIPSSIAPSGSGVNSAPESFVAFLHLRGALSFRPRGRPSFTSLFGVRAASSGKVSLYQVRPLQMLRIVFSLTPKISATYVGESFALSGNRIWDKRKMSITCSLVSTARAFELAGERIEETRVGRGSTGFYCIPRS